MSEPETLNRRQMKAHVIEHLLFLLDQGEGETERHAEAERLGLLRSEADALADEVKATLLRRANKYREGTMSWQPWDAGDPAAYT